jgi:5'(3')-deoxyribonucleotidase
VKPIILLDVDGPLADFAGAYLREFADITGRVHSVQDVTEYHMHDNAFFGAACAAMGLQRGELTRRIVDRVISPGWCAALEPHPGAQAAVSRLQELGDVYVVTSPWDSSPTWQHERLHWCEKHFEISRGNVIHAGKKHLIRGDVFVDDKASHVEEWHREWPDGLGVLFDMHHNKNEFVAATRGGWPFVIGHVEALVRTSDDRSDMMLPAGRGR